MIVLPQYLRATRYILYGMIPHGLLFFILWTWEPPKVSPIPKPVPVILAIQTKKNRVPEAPPRPKSRSEERVPSAKKPGRSPNSEVKSLPKGTARGDELSEGYASLLPTPSEIQLSPEPNEASQDGISSSEHAWAPNLNLAKKKTLLTRGGNLRAIIDIPLSARSIIEAGKATARLTFDPPSRRLKLTILQGHPLLRAVLFESFYSDETRTAILESIDTFDTRELVIALHLIEGRHMSADDDSFRWRENRIDITLTRGPRAYSPQGLQGGGLSLSLALPDEKADRAREQDENAFARLKQSPAYLSELTDFEFK